MPKIIEDVENRILRSARQRLLGGDLSSFSARGIAEDCGIAVGTIYNYYRDKESIMAAVMAQDWQAELTKAGERIDAVPSIEEGVRCLYEAMRSFSRVYESVWASYPTGEGFGSLFRTRHRQLLSQIEAQLSGGTLSYAQCEQASQRFSEIKALLDEKETRWLELSL